MGGWGCLGPDSDSEGGFPVAGFSYLSTVGSGLTGCGFFFCFEWGRTREAGMGVCVRFHSNRLTPATGFFFSPLVMYLVR